VKNHSQILPGMGSWGVKSEGEVALVTVKGDADEGATSAFVLPLVVM
jgi:hypothetical protein